MKAKIQFSVVGSVTQRIHILNDETAETVTKKLNTGEYATTIMGGDAENSDGVNAYIVRVSDNKKIALIEETDNECEYTEFETI